MKCYTKNYNGHNYTIMLQQYKDDFLVTKMTDGIEVCCMMFGAAKVARMEYDKSVNLLKVLK